MTYLEQFIAICAKTNMDDSNQEESYRYRHSAYGKRQVGWFKWIINITVNKGKQ